MDRASGAAPDWQGPSQRIATRHQARRVREATERECAAAAMRAPFPDASERAAVAMEQHERALRQILARVDAAPTSGGGHGARHEHTHAQRHAHMQARPRASRSGARAAPTKPSFECEQSQGSRQPRGTHDGHFLSQKSATAALGSHCTPAVSARLFSVNGAAASDTPLTATTRRPSSSVGSTAPTRARSVGPRMSGSDFLFDSAEEDDNGADSPLGVGLDARESSRGARAAKCNQPRGTDEAGDDSEQSEFDSDLSDSDESALQQGWNDSAAPVRVGSRSGLAVARVGWYGRSARAEPGTAVAAPVDGSGDDCIDGGGGSVVSGDADAAIDARVGEGGDEKKAGGGLRAAAFDPALREVSSNARAVGRAAVKTEACMTEKASRRRDVQGCCCGCSLSGCECSAEFVGSGDAAVVGSDGGTSGGDRSGCNGGNALAGTVTAGFHTVLDDEQRRGKGVRPTVRGSDALPIVGSDLAGRAFERPACASGQKRTEIGLRSKARCLFAAGSQLSEVGAICSGVHGFEANGSVGSGAGRSVYGNGGAREGASGAGVGGGDGGIADDARAHSAPRHRPCALDLLAASAREAATSRLSLALVHARLKLYIDEASLLSPSFVEAAQAAIGDDALFRFSARGAAHFELVASEEGALERALLAALSLLCEASAEQVLMIRWYLHNPIASPSQLLSRWQAAVEHVKQSVSLQHLSVTYCEKRAAISLLLHSDGWLSFEDYALGTVPRAVALLLSCVRYGHAIAASLTIRSARRVAVLTRPDRSPLRALACQSGALVVLLRKPARQLRPWDEPGTRRFARGEATLLVCGPRPLLRAAKHLVAAWLGTPAPH